MFVASARLMSSRAPGPDQIGRAAMISRTVRVAGRPTSVRLELETWEALDEVAVRERKSLADLVTEIDRTRTSSTLSGRVHVFLLDYYRRAAEALKRESARLASREKTAVRAVGTRR